MSEVKKIEAFLVMWYSRRCRGEVKRYATKNATKVVYPTTFHKLRNAFFFIQNYISG